MRSATVGDMRTVGTDRGAPPLNRTPPCHAAPRFNLTPALPLALTFAAATTAGAALAALVAAARGSDSAHQAALRGGDRDVVDAGLAASHQAVGVELPLLVAVAAPPLAGRVVPLVLEADGDAVAGVRPQLLAEPVVELAPPLVGEEGADLGAAGEEAVAVAPDGVLRIGEGDALGVAAVPGILRGLDLGEGALPSERGGRGGRTASAVMAEPLGTSCENDRSQP
ncbi:hypothetical protein GCM10020254_33990 [Streptomyces goshikiensis]